MRDRSSRQCALVKPRRAASDQGVVAATSKMRTRPAIGPVDPLLHRRDLSSRQRDPCPHGDGKTGVVSRSPDWRRSEDYADLSIAGGRNFAWEWLRRTPSYRRAWQAHLDGSDASATARTFGLEQYEDPSRPTPVARPVWSAGLDPAVIRAAVSNPIASSDERIDLRALARYVSVAIDDNEVEHLLLSDGFGAVRIDILEGTLIGVPASLRYLLSGVASVSAPLSSLSTLLHLVQDGRPLGNAINPGRRQARWILELRTADALEMGAENQQIARALFGSRVADHHWRQESAAYRQRVQRLVRNARRRLARPLDPRWFA